MKLLFFSPKLKKYIKPKKCAQGLEIDLCPKIPLFEPSNNLSRMWVAKWNSRSVKLNPRVFQRLWLLKKLYYYSMLFKVDQSNKFRLNFCSYHAQWGFFGGFVDELGVHIWKWKGKKVKKHFFFFSFSFSYKYKFIYF